MAGGECTLGQLEIHVGASMGALAAAVLTRIRPAVRISAASPAIRVSADCELDRNSADGHATLSVMTVTTPAPYPVEMIEAPPCT